MFSLSQKTKDEYLEGYEPLILTIEDEPFSHNDLVCILNSDLFKNERWRDVEQSPEDSTYDRQSIAIFYKTEKQAVKAAITAVKMLRVYHENI